MALRDFFSRRKRANPKQLTAGQVTAQKVAADALRAYEGAARGRRTDGWTSVSSGPNAENRPALRLLRERAQDLYQNNPHAAQIIRSYASNMIGTGIRPNSKSKKAMKLWNEWQKHCDATGGLTFYGLQELAVISWLVRGEVLARRRRRRPEDMRPGLPPLQIQLLEGDYLDSDRTAERTNGRRVIQGVEFDPIDRVVGYWLFDRHPTDSAAYVSGLATSKLVDASGVAHLRRITRPGQVRGITWLAPVMMALRDLEDYADAERLRKKLEACFVAFVITDDDGQGTITDVVTDASGEVVESLEPGLIPIVRGGKDIRMAQPAATGGYKEYYKVNVRSIAAGVGSTYELISGDLEGTNYSSIRAGLVEFRRLVTTLVQNTFVPLFCQPVWEWFIEQAVTSGMLPERADCYPVEWTAQGFEQVDRLKDAQADKLELEIQSSSQFDIWRRLGKDPERMLDELKRVIKEFEALGLALSIVPKASAPAAEPAAEPPIDKSPKKESKKA